MALSTAQQTVIRRDITQTFRQEFIGATPFYPTVCTVVPSSGRDEAYGWLGGMPGVREWIGERRFKQLRAADYILPNKHWESSLELERTMVDDDRYGLIRPQIRNLATEAAYHPDELLIINVINNAESLPCFDGQNFFDTSHVWGESGVQSNILQVPVADPANVTTEEFRDALDEAVLRMISFKNDWGKYLVRPTVDTLTDLHVLAPLSLAKVANRVRRQMLAIETGGTGGTTGVAATTNVMLAAPEISITPYMSAASGGSDVKFDLYWKGGIMKPYVFQDRERLRFDTEGFGGIKEKVIKAMTEARYNVGLLAWWTAVRVEFTQA